MTQPYGRGAGRAKRGVAIGLACLVGLAAPAARAEGARTLLVLGDSLAAGYGLPQSQGFQARLRAALAKAGWTVTMLDGAVPGDTSAGGRARLAWLLGGAKPDAAIVELGANDGLRGLSVAAMQANLAAILDTLAARRIPVVLAGMYPPPNLGPDYTKAFRAAFGALARRPGVVYEDFFLAGVAAHPALLQADGLHPNAAGERVVVADILPLVTRVLGEAGGADGLRGRAATP